jgi:hypothetical protein
MGSLLAIFFCQNSGIFFSQNLLYSNFIIGSGGPRFDRRLSLVVLASTIVSAEVSPPYITQNGFSSSNFFMPKKWFFFLPNSDLARFLNL